MKLKANAIDQARIDLRALSQEILKLRGKVATLESEIKELEGKMAENEKLQADATALRQKENAAFMAESTEMKQALAALQDAITVLIKGSAPGASLLQSEGRAASKAMLTRVLELLPARASALPEKEMSLLSDFMEAKAGGQYAPQSVTIQGILKDLYNTFSTDLEAATGKEASSNRDYELFIKEKSAELAAMGMAKKSREEQKAEAEVKLADATTLYDDTDKQLAADIAFFDATKEACLAKSDEWNTRKKLREEELAGITEALTILSSDEARELFASAIKIGKETGVDASYDPKSTTIVPLSFLQTADGDAARVPITKAYALLKAKATEAHSLRLAQLAVQVREAKVGHFDAVIKAIDEMLAALAEENLADIAKRDQCKAEYQDTESTSKQLSWEIEKNEAKINKLEAIIAEKEAEKAKTIQHIADVEAQIELMIKVRTEENQAFLAAKDEDLKAIDLLEEAKTVLLKYYEEHDIKLGKIEAGVKEMTLAQQGPDFEVSQWQAPDATFKGKGARKGESKDIVSILTMLIEYLNDEIRNAMKDEESAQLAFEKAKAAAEKLKEDLIAKKISLEEQIAARTEEKAAEEATKATNEALLKDELDYKAKITPDCDWIIGAFEKRAARRTAEMNGLTGAKDYLAGANEAALVQKGRSPASFDDNKLSGIKFLGLSH
jgi:hypothetical protein